MKVIHQLQCDGRYCHLTEGHTVELTDRPVSDQIPSDWIYVKFPNDKEGMYFANLDCVYDTISTIKYEIDSAERERKSREANTDANFDIDSTVDVASNDVEDSWT